MIKFTVDGNPQRKQRPRFTKAKGYVRTYTPVETVNYENWIKICYKNQVGDMAFINDDPLRVSIIAYYQVPKSWSKKKTEQALADEIKPANSIDVDNTAKVVLDALNGVAFKDDHYVTDLEVKKRYSNIPRVEIAIERVKP